MIWDQADINDLKTLWADGVSPSEIGRRLHRSKNSVVGQRHRLKLEPRPSPIIKGGRTAIVAMRAAVTGDNPTLPALASLSAPLPKPAVVMFKKVATISDAGRPILSTEERDRRILLMVDLTHRQCAEALGISHHAVRYVREKHRSRIAPVASSPAAQYLSLAVVVPYRAPTPAVPPLATYHHSAPSSCQWPTGKRTSVYHTYRACGCADVVPGKPYCAEHTKRAYIKVPGRGDYSEQVA